MCFPPDNKLKVTPALIQNCLGSYIKINKNYCDRNHISKFARFDYIHFLYVYDICHLDLLFKCFLCVAELWGMFVITILLNLKAQIVNVIYLGFLVNICIETETREPDRNQIILSKYDTKEKQYSEMSRSRFCLDAVGYHKTITSSVNLIRFMKLFVL